MQSVRTLLQTAAIVCALTRGQVLPQRLLLEMLLLDSLLSALILLSHLLLMVRPVDQIRVLLFL